MKTKLVYLLLLLVCYFSLFAGSTASAAETPQLDYYYGTTCPHCIEIKPFLEDLEKKNPQIRFNRIEVFQSRDNAIALEKAFTQYGIRREDRGVPAILINNKFLIGSDIITANLEKEIARIDTNKTSPVASLSPETTFLAITGAALVDSINPCAIFVLIVLLSSLLVLHEPSDRKVIACAVSFISAVYLAFFLIGLGVLYSINFLGLSGWLYRIVGALALVIGLLNLKDAFAYGAGGFTMEIPRSWRPRLVKILARVSTPPGAFIAGFIVTLFEAPCIGGPYLFAIGLMAQDMNWLKIILLLLYYNLIFVLPLIVIATLVIRGKLEVDKAEAWQKKSIKKLHLIGGLVMTALGLWMILK